MMRVAWISELFYESSICVVGMSELQLCTISPVFRTYVDLYLLDLWRFRALRNAGRNLLRRVVRKRWAREENGR
jgi:hypothetical protein